LGSWVDNFSPFLLPGSSSSISFLWWLYDEKAKQKHCNCLYIQNNKTIAISHSWREAHGACRGDDSHHSPNTSTWPWRMKKTGGCWRTAVDRGKWTRWRHPL
jgi:hypothetical protein